MNKDCKYYKFTFIININGFSTLISGGLYAKDDDTALDKLPNAIQKRIGGITNDMHTIKVYNKNKRIRYFYSWEEMLQEISKA